MSLLDSMLDEIFDEANLFKIANETQKSLMRFCVRAWSTVTFRAEGSEETQVLPKAAVFRYSNIQVIYPPPMPGVAGTIIFKLDEFEIETSTDNVEVWLED